jgi:hypothetical protein
MENLFIFYAVLVFVIAWLMGRNIGRRNAANRLIEFENKIADREARIGSQLAEMRSDGVLLPSLARWADSLQEASDNIDVESLLKKSRPAPAAAERVKEANRKARQQKQIADILKNQIDLYESLAPWLREFSQLTVDEIVSGLKESNSTAFEDDENPAQKYLPKTEWESLTETERLQRALDNYNNKNRKKSLWQIGIDFERYIGFLYEEQGFKVKFHGAMKGVEDLGIDLICSKKTEIVIVQCKRLAAIKEIPVRENVIAQIYGASVFYQLKNSIPKKIKVRTALITSYVLSEQAKEFATHLGIEVQENVQIEKYPTIKCNINPNTGEKIFHLPFDQQYDNIVIGDVDGECYVETVAEAIKKGFRHAYRWRGNAEGGL